MLPKSCNIILFGPSGAGKSSLIKYFKNYNTSTFLIALNNSKNISNFLKNKLIIP